uniref:Ig-like domain-containing protein n=1 Tax=Macrostomum lignano TaxID=282301 RepID=A0A1I8FD35_9PLAT
PTATARRHTRSRVTGRSKLTFHHVFSVGLESQFPAGRGVDQRRPYPVPPVPKPDRRSARLAGHLEHPGVASSRPGVVQFVALKTYDKRDLLTVQARSLNGAPQDLVYLTDKIQAPPDFFYIVVTGKDSEGRDFQRYNTPTAIRARERRRPRVECRGGSGVCSGSGSGSSVDVKGQAQGHGDAHCEVISPRDYEAHLVQSVRRSGRRARQRIQSASSQANQRVQTYQLRNVGVVAAGVYELVALTNSGQNHSDKIQVIVLPRRPPGAHCGRNTTVATGTDAELKCLVVVDEAYDRSNNIRELELSIRVGNTSRVTVTESRRQGSIDKRLMIRSVSRRDVGKYICKAEYDGQGSGIRSSRDTWLRIQEAPIVRVTSRRINYQRGDSIRARNNVLQILDAKEEHKGVYNCKAENSGGVSAEPVSIVYVERPTVKAVNNSVVGIVGERRQLRCNATGQPVPTVTWRRNGVPIVAGP